MADVYGFGEQTARKLEQIVRVDGVEFGTGAESRNTVKTIRLIKAPSGGIPARSGNTPGSATGS